MAKKAPGGAPRCHCGNALSYEMCCGCFHAGLAAPDAQSLMRSRYSAFVVRDAPYLLRTWYRTTRPSQVAFEPQQKWLRLEVVGWSADETAAEVEFIARFRIAGASAQRHHEVSRFRLEAGEWFYVDGNIKN